MVRKLLIVGAVLLLFAIAALPASAAVCPDPDCPNPDCPENKYQYGDGKNAGQTGISGVCPEDCIPADHDYHYDYSGPGPHRSGRDR